MENPTKYKLARILIITMVSISVGLYQSARAQEKFIEAEAATLSNGARIEDCATCSGGHKVAALGDLANGKLQFVLNVPRRGLYPLNVYFRVSDDRSLNIWVNQEAVAQKVVFRRVAPVEQSSVQQVFMALKAGKNTISFDNPVEGGPELDRIGLIATPVKALSFKGLIKDKSGQPVPGVSVQLRGNAERMVTTNAAGVYTINDVPAGEYLISAFANGKLFSPHARSVAKNEVPAALNFTAQNFRKSAADVKKLSNGGNRIDYNIKTGTADFYNNDKLILANAYAEVHVPQVLSSMDYAQHIVKEEDFSDQLGRGKLFTVTSAGAGLPEMVQEYWLYTNQRFMLTRVSAKGEKQLETRYMSPLKSETSLQVLPAGENYSLFVPFDNDKWVRYVAFPFDKVVSSHEVSVLFNKKTNQGLVIGSVDHDTWKTGVVTATSGHTLNRLEAYGGLLMLLPGIS